MKKNPISFYIFPLLLAAVITGCTRESITMEAGGLPYGKTIDETAGFLRSTGALTNKIPVALEEDESSVTQEIFYMLSKPAQTTLTVTAAQDEKLVEDYNIVNNTQLQALPADNVHFENEGTLSVAAGEQESPKIKFTISTAGLEPATTYLLPISVVQVPAGIQAANDKQILYYGITIRQKITTVFPNDQWNQVEMPPMVPDAMIVFYVNTANYQPLIADVYGVKKISNIDFSEIFYTVGSIVNLKTTTLGYDPATGRASLRLSSDMREVLEQAGKFIRPLQDHGRKVCLCIESADKKLGFCSMTEAQITDFTRQVKDVIDLYGIDGINLWDQIDGYGKEGISGMNTTSYPKLIKSLREALPGKLLTLVDRGEPTEYFHDVDQCGGIEVGKYIDYAWHDYANDEELTQIIEPWENDHPYSEYTRKQIAGLTPEQYGSINVPYYTGQQFTIKLRDDSQRRVIDWKTAKRKKNNLIVFGFDLTANEQTTYEGFFKLSIPLYIDLITNGGLSWGQNKYPPYNWGIISGDFYYGYAALDYNMDGGYKIYAKGWVRPEGF